MKLTKAAERFIEPPETGLLIDGKFVKSEGGGTFDTLNPADGTLLMKCASAEAADVDLAVRAARRAFEGSWKRTSPAERGRLLWRLADLIERDREAIAQIETLDNGKPFRIAYDDDLPSAISTIRYFAGWATKLAGETIPISDLPDVFNYTLREPVGVVGQIVPWNYPFQMAVWKIAPALACGNCCVLKPAEQTPLTAVWLGQLVMEAGFPAGVVNILTGMGETAGAALVSHPDVDKVAFTGSTEVGRSIVTASAGNLKRVSLELGGKSPNIVFADADMDQAIAGAAFGIFYNMGQDCCAGSRLYVQKEVYDEVLNGLVDRAKNLVMGNGLDPKVDQGPLVSTVQRNRVERYLEVGRAAGAQVVAGGGRPDDEALKSGYFIQPTVLADVTSDMIVAREEIFGPVVAVMPFTDVDEVVAMANDTHYGLAAGMWTRDMTKAHQVSKALRAGNVYVNCYNMYTPGSPFGGYKQSGYGREDCRETLDLYLETKSIWLKYA